MAPKYSVMKGLYCIFLGWSCYNFTSPSQAARLKRKFSVAGGIFLSFKDSRVMYCLPSSSVVAKDFRLFRRSFVLLLISCKENRYETTLSKLVVDKIRKPFEVRSGLIQCWSWSGSKLIDTDCIPNFILKKVNLFKKTTLDKKRKITKDSSYNNWSARSRYLKKNYWQIRLHICDKGVQWHSGRVLDLRSRPWGYKTFSMLNSAEHEIYLVHKC